MQQSAPVAADTYVQIFDEIEDCNLLIDGADRIIDVNRAAINLYGYTRYQFCQLKFSELVDTAITEIPTCLPGHGISSIAWHRRSSTSSFLAEIRLCSLPLQRRGCLTLVRIRDITAVRQTELKKQQEALLFQSALHKAWVQTIEVLAAASEAKDPYTSGHQKRVASLAVAIANELKLPESQITGLRMAALIHDIGKLTLSSEILSKPVAFSSLERQMVELHVQAGYDLLKGLDLPWNVADVVHQHHERDDGSGYPDHLKSSETLFKSKILGVADVVEAMSSHRPYRPSLGLEAALNEIQQGRCRLYDPEIVDTCVRLFKENSFAFV